MYEGAIGIVASEIAHLGGIGIFLSFLLFGEVVIFAAALLIKEGIFTLGEVFFFSLAAVIFVDLFWYLCGKYFPKSKISPRFQKHVFGRVGSFLNTLTPEDKAQSLIAMKFFIGVRIAYMLYLSQQNVPVKKLIAYELAGSVIFVTCVISLGYFLGNLVGDYFYDSRYIIMFGLGFLFVALNLIITKLFITK